MTPEEERDSALAQLARLRAGLAAGLTVEQSARLQGTTPEELTADATTLAAELGVTSAPAPAHRSGGNQGYDVDSNPTGLAAGAEEYARKHPKREQSPTTTTQGPNPFVERTYSMNGR